MPGRRSARVRPPTITAVVGGSEPVPSDGVCGDTGRSVTSSIRHPRIEDESQPRLARLATVKEMLPVFSQRLLMLANSHLVVRL